MARIAIVGAGIGGLTSALALSGRGHEITLIERRTGFAETGAGIQLSPNASRILLGLGLGTALSRLATTPDRLVIRRLRTGAEIAAVPLGQTVAERFGAPYWSIARADLHTTLLDAVRGRADVRLRVGRVLNSLTQHGTGVRLGCDTAGGEQDLIEADIAVAADGLWSAARACLGDRRDPVASGYVAYRATLPGDRAPAELQGKSSGLWLGRGRHVVHYPIRGGRELNVVAVMRSAAAPTGWSTPVEADEVAAGFPDAAPPLRAILEAGGPWSAWSLAELPVGRMARDRVALLGDAAHPALPFLAQGAAMAIEDAAVLAEEIGRAEAIGPDAIARYGRRRIARVTRIQREARRNGRTYHAGGVVAFARNLAMGRLGPAGLLDRYAWLYGWRVEPA